LIYFHFTI